MCKTKHIEKPHLYMVTRTVNFKCYHVDQHAKDHGYHAI